MTKLNIVDTNQNDPDEFSMKVEDVKKMLGLNERIASVDTPIGPDSDKSLLDTIPDTICCLK